MGERWYPEIMERLRRKQSAAAREAKGGAPAGVEQGEGKDGMNMGTGGQGATVQVY